MLLVVACDLDHHEASRHLVIGAPPGAGGVLVVSVAHHPVPRLHVVFDERHEGPIECGGGRDCPRLPRGLLGNHRHQHCECLKGERDQLHRQS